MAQLNSQGSISSALCKLRNCGRCGRDFFGGTRVCKLCRVPRGCNIPAKYGEPPTVREKQIMDRICEGKANKQIAFELHLTELTVKTYTSEIFTKAGVANRTALAMWWRDRCDISNKSA